MITTSLWWVGIDWWAVGLAIIVLPAVSLAASLGLRMAISRRQRMEAVPAAWSGPDIAAAATHLICVIAAGVAVTFVTPANGAGGLLMFLGLSMLIAAGAGYQGCEVLAVPNLLLGRRDAIWCPVYCPIDQAAQRRVMTSSKQI